MLLFMKLYIPFMIILTIILKLNEDRKNNQLLKELNTPINLIELKETPPPTIQEEFYALNEKINANMGLIRALKRTKYKDDLDKARKQKQIASLEYQIITWGKKLDKLTDIYDFEDIE